MRLNRFSGMFGFSVVWVGQVLSLLGDVHESPIDRAKRQLKSRGRER
jgi:hypothetical protein